MALASLKVHFRCLKNGSLSALFPTLCRRTAAPNIFKRAKYRSHGGEEIMVGIARRRLLQLSSAGAAAAGLTGIFSAGRAPAFGQASTLHWLRWSDFVPASDQLLRNQIVPECDKALGIKLTLETINANDIQARITSAIQAGAGADIILVVNNWPQLYAA